MEPADDPKLSEGTDAFHVVPALRQRVADHVFEALARAIFKGELRPGEPLPPQRDLAKRFHISPLVVRQAIHRLEDFGLVRVRQGSMTLVLDPDESSDIRLVQLRMEVSAPSENLAADAIENQLLFVIPLLELAERRITPEQLAVLRCVVEDAANRPANDASLRLFRTRYWQQIATATRNSLFQQQVRWWIALTAELERRGRGYRFPHAPSVFDLYRRLNAALEKREGAATLYLDTIRPLLDRFDRQRGQDPRAGGSSAE